MEIAPVPEKPFVTGAVTSNSLSVAWEVQGNVSQITHYTLCFRTIEEGIKGANAWEMVNTKNANQEFHLQNLEPNTSYQFRVASNSNGKQSYMSAISITTKTAKDLKTGFQAPTVQLVNVNGRPTHNSVPLSWIVDGDTSSVTHYTITYKVVGEDADFSNVGQSWIIYQTQDAKRRCIVENLEPRTSYRFYVSSNTDKGKGPPSPISNAISTEDDPRCIPIPQNPRAGPVTSDSVPLSWNIIGNKMTITHYTLICQRIDDKEPLVTYYTKDAQTMYTVKELKPATSYKCSVVSNTQHGQSQPSNTITISTSTIEADSKKAQKPPIPQELNFESPIQQDSVSLTWQINGKRNCITHFTILFRRVTNKKKYEWASVETKGNATCWTVNELHPETKYQFQVSSNTQFGPSILSNRIIVKTPLTTTTTSLIPIKPVELGLPIPLNPVQAGQVTHDSVPLAWEVSGETTQVSHYTVSCKRANGTGPLLTYNTESTQTKYTVTELNPGTAYEFYVTLKTNAGQTNCSQLSESITTHGNPSSSLYEQPLPLPQQPTLAGMVTHNSVPLTWEVKGNISHITNYKLLYKKVDSQGPQMIVNTKDAKQSYIVENLDPNTSYFFWVLINIAQLGFQSVPSIISEVIRTSPDPNGSTLEQMIPQPNKPTLAVPPRHDSLSLTWEVTGKTSLVTHYTLTYRKDTNAPWSTIETGSTNTEFTICNLESETAYKFRVTASTDKAQSLPSETSDVITTAEDPQAKSLMQGLPPRPTEPKLIGSISHNCVPIIWKVQGNTSNVTHYTITYKVIGETPSKWTAVETEDTENYYNARDLQPETNYQFRVASNTELGQSLPSKTSDTFRTSKEPLSMSTNPPATPKKPRAAGAPSHDSVPLSWKVPGNTNDISHYTVSYRKTMSTNASLISVETYDSETHFTVTDLDPHTAYQFHVSSNTDKGLSLPSISSDIIYTIQAPTSSQHQKPLKPCKLTCIDSQTHDALTLTWKVEGDASLVAYYKLSFRPVDTDQGQKAPWQVTKTEETWATVANLEPKTSYEFSVTIKTKDGQVCEGNFEEIFMTADLPDHLSLQNRPLPCPGTPQLAPDQKPTQHTLPIAWEMDADGIQITHFCLFYRHDRHERDECWEEIEIPGIRQHYTIKNLQPGTPYHFRIKAHSSINSSEFSKTAGPFETESRTEGQIYRDDLHAQSKLVSSNKDMPIYQVPLRLAYKHEAERTQRFEFGTPSRIPKQEKIILVVGATGAGKSTLINGLLNHVLGVEWDEKFRFRLVQESGVFEDQHKSQTKVISVYTLHHHPAFKVPFTVTIVDTPGFGDTEGIDKDKLITDSITHLFSKEEYGIDHIDAIGFVVQSSLSRLTPTQKYIFESILSLFGKDIGENIFLLITFSDSQKPPVLASTEEASVPFRDYFKFNNSALFAMNDTKDNEFDLMFWKMGTISFQKFLDELMKVEEKSLYLTKEVLEERQHLEVHVSGIQQDITSGLNKLDQFKVELDVVKRHEADIEKNRDFTYTVDEVTMVQVDTPHGKHVTNCMTCNRTCHYPCAYANDEDKKKCSAMDRTTGNCKVCPNKCIWNLHRNVPYKIESITKSVVKTSNDLKKRYMSAKGKKMNAEKLTEEILRDFFNLEINVLYLADEIKTCLVRLSEIALRPNPLSTVEFLEILMKSEKAEARPGFQARLDQLESVNAQAKILFAMSSDDGYDPFAEYREALGQSNSSPARMEAVENFRRNNPSLVQRGWNKVKEFLNID